MKLFPERVPARPMVHPLYVPSRIGSVYDTSVTSVPSVTPAPIDDVTEPEGSRRSGDSLGLREERRSRVPATTAEEEQIDLRAWAAQPLIRNGFGMDSLDSFLEWLKLNGGIALGSAISGIGIIAASVIGFRHQQNLARDDRAWDQRVAVYMEVGNLVTRANKYVNAVYSARCMVDNSHTASPITDRQQDQVLDIRVLTSELIDDLDAGLKGLSDRLELFATSDVTRVLKNALANHKRAMNQEVAFADFVVYTGFYNRELKERAWAIQEQGTALRREAEEDEKELRLLLRRDLGHVEDS